MSIKVFQTNKTGKIEFTRCELEKLLNETYNEGYRDGENHAKSSYWTWTSPSISTTGHPIITYRNSTDPIDGLIAGETTINGAADATIATTDSLDEKGTQRTCQFDSMTFNLNDLAKTVDAMLSGKVDLFNPTSVKTGKIAVDNPFENLGRELVNL